MRNIEKRCTFSWRLAIAVTLNYEARKTHTLSHLELIYVANEMAGAERGRLHNYGAVHSSPSYLMTVGEVDANTKICFFFIYLELVVF